jgi:hypothetical protein
MEEMQRRERWKIEELQRREGWKMRAVGKRERWEMRAVEKRAVGKESSRKRERGENKSGGK